MDRNILNVVRWIWRNKVATTIGVSMLLAWVAPDLLRQIVGHVFNMILTTVATLLSIIVGETTRNSASIGGLIGIGVCIWAVYHMVTAPFRKKPKK